MKTCLTTSTREAAEYIRSGQVVAFPTETVYGLGADAFSPEAVRHIFEAKGRPSDNPLIVHIASVDDIARLVARRPETAVAMIERFFPGPLTLILPKHESVPSVVTAGLDTVGIRMPAHPTARAFLEACERPVAAPSANRSGRPSPTSWEAVLEDLNGRIPCILKGDRTEVGLESTVVDLSQDRPVVLRSGAVTLDMLRSVVPETVFATSTDDLHRSPGTRHRHYAPHAKVVLIEHAGLANPDAESGYIGLESPSRSHAFGVVHVCGSLEEYGRELFHFFRTCDEAGLRRIYCQQVDPEGLGHALMDRLVRAARE